MTPNAVGHDIELPPSATSCDSQTLARADKFYREESYTQAYATLSTCVTQQKVEPYRLFMLARVAAAMGELALSKETAFSLTQLTICPNWLRALVTKMWNLEPPKPFDFTLPVANLIRAARSTQNPVDVVQQAHALIQSQARAPQPDVDVRNTQLVLALAYAKSRACLQALEALPRSEAGWANEARAAAVMMRAECALRRNDVLDAQKLYDSVELNFASTDDASEAAFFAAWLSFRLGNYENAISRFQSHRQHYPNESRADDVYWWLVYTNYKTKNFSACVAMADACTKAKKCKNTVPQLSYWSAKCKALRDNVSPDEKVLKVSATFPYDYYGVLAQVMTGKTLEGAIPAVAPLAAETFTLDDTEKTLRDSALNDLADYYVANAVSPRRMSNIATQYAVGRGARNFAKAVRGDTEALQMLYPNPKNYLPESDDKWFLTALMRRESAFQWWAHSSANASGLIQLIAPTALQLAPMLQRKTIDAFALFDSQINVLFAKKYVELLEARFHHPALIAAAYNGGPNAVIDWFKDQQQWPLDEWVEEIRFRETRLYVRDVLASTWVYSFLYQTPQARSWITATVTKPASDGVNF